MDEKPPAPRTCRLCGAELPDLPALYRHAGWSDHEAGAPTCPPCCVVHERPDRVEATARAVVERAVAELRRQASGQFDALYFAQPAPAGPFPAIDEPVDFVVRHVYGAAAPPPALLECSSCGRVIEWKGAVVVEAIASDGREVLCDRCRPSFIRVRRER
jgi:hypothetical protein